MKVSIAENSIYSNDIGAIIYVTVNFRLLIIEVNDPHEGLRKTESQWPIHQINWQKSRYIYDMFYTYERISKEVYDYCINNKIVDAALIAKWKKPGYERLCSTYVINPRNYKFGTVSICRVPKQYLAPGTEIEDPTTGCRGCASGSSHNIFGNKYGQYLAAIQIAREERAAKTFAQVNMQKSKQTNSAQLVDTTHEDNEDDEANKEDHNDMGPVMEADGSGKKAVDFWATDQEEVELTQDMIGQLAPDAKQEAMAAVSRSGSMSNHKRSDEDNRGQRMETKRAKHF